MNTPLRAAVSAFGFGGINGHLLFEEWDHEEFKVQSSKLKAQSSASSIQQPVSSTPVAIVGMEAVFGSLNSLRDFQETVLNGETIIGKRPKQRWKGCDNIAKMHLGIDIDYGGFMEDLSLYIGEFRIPPNEIPDILPQHLLMLKVAARAMEDAGLPLRENRPRMGAIIGMGFDFEATNFHLRWNLINQVRVWKKSHDDLNKDDLDNDETASWLESLQDSCCPPLTSTRTLGALGGIIASRIAREFCFGGPSFVVSNEEASGLKALEIGVRSLQQNETDAVLVGAVDFASDVRNVITSHKIRAFTKKDEIRPFDKSADGPLPADGAVSLVLKRLDTAIKDGDRIYAVIKGIGNASGGGIEKNSPSKDAYILSLKRCLEDADTLPSFVSFIETHGSGDPLEDKIETEALHDFFSYRKNPCAIGSVKPSVGHTGAVAGLASVVKTSLCLYQEIIPPLKNFTEPKKDIWEKGIFHIPAYPQFWLRDRKDGPRRACACSMTADGNCSHVLLESFEYASMDIVPEKVRWERKSPLGFRRFGLFVVEGNSKSALIKSLDELDRYIKKQVSFPFSSGAIERAAFGWYAKNRLDFEKKYAVSIVADDISQLEKWIIEAKTAVSSNTPKMASGPGGICYSPAPLNGSGEVAFVFPGSGNHYVGMGREIGVQWPEILRKMDDETLRLKTQMIPQCYVPQRVSWAPGWEKEAHEEIISDPLNMIFGQVVHGGVVSNLVKSFGIKPSAVIGYSLGESAGLFAMGAWPDRGKMLERMLDTNLFTTELAGPCNAARKVWNVPVDEDVNWCVAAVNRSADIVRNIIRRWPTTRLLIVNTPNECVIGGRKHHVEAAIKKLGCEAVFLEGVVTVHCDAAMPSKDAYRELHIFPTSRPKGIRFYSCALGRAYDLTSESAASSILNQAISGFDFSSTIHQAYKDGIRIFLEMGPHSSCTRMISRILDTKPHLAVSACVRSEDDTLTILKFLGSLITERVAVNIESLYGSASYAQLPSESRNEKSNRQVTLIIGGKAPSPSMPRTKEITKNTEDISIEHQASSIKYPASGIQYHDLMKNMGKSIQATSEAHKTFLDFSDQATRAFAQTFGLQTRLLETIISEKDRKSFPDLFSTVPKTALSPFNSVLSHKSSDLSPKSSALSPSSSPRSHATCAWNLPQGLLPRYWGRILQS